MKMSCSECGGSFEAGRSTARFCSNSCKFKYHRKTQSELARNDWHSPAEAVEAAINEIQRQEPQEGEAVN